jgi:hypothetical protein
VNDIAPLLELMRQVRGFTLELLDAAPEDWLRWAPEGTSNHILWHAGHALYVQDRLSIVPLTGASELPEGWEATFGSQCRPVKETSQWPESGVVRRLLQTQRERLTDLYSQAGPDDLAGRMAGILHGWHDEARHQGEIYLLYKLCRARKFSD